MSSAASSVLVLVALVGCSTPLQNRPVLELPEGVDDWWFTVSPGGRAAAYAERRGSDAYLVAGGRHIGPYP